MARHTLVRQLALVSAISGAIFATSATAQLFKLSGSGATSSFPNAIKLNGTLVCNLPNLGIYIDTTPGAPYLVLTDKSALADPNFDPTAPAPGTEAHCTETLPGPIVLQGTGTFQQIAKSSTITAGGGQGPNPTGLVVQPTLNLDGTTTHTFRFYVDDRTSTDEVARYQITFPSNSPLCIGVTIPEDCVHKMGLPDPLNTGEEEVKKGSTTFCAGPTTSCPTAVPFDQYVMEQMSVTANAAGDPIAFTEFQARWLHNGSEDGTDVILDAVKLKGSTQPLRTSAESTLDIFVEFFVGPVVTSPGGVTPIYVLSSADFDAPTAITAAGAKTIEVNGATVDCRNISTVDINGDGRNDWRCGAESLQFINATGLGGCTTQTEWTAAFAVQVVFGGKERTARDLAVTFPINCN